MSPQVLTISLKSGNAKETGRPYDYVSIEVEGVEIDRLFIKGTEKTYFQSLIGRYEKSED